MNADTTTDLITEEQIARCAYDIWEREGRPDGHAMKHWLQAEATLRNSTPIAAKAGTKPPLSARPRRAPASKAAGGKREKKFEMIS